MNEFADSMIQSERSSISSDQDQENSWVTASQHGDTRAFNRLVLKWEKSVYNVALRILRDREEAAEATQDAFLLAFKNIKRFRKDSKFSTWLYRIIINHCLTQVKQRPPGSHCSLEDETGVENPASQLRITGNQVGNLLEREQRERVMAAVWHLPPEQQAVIELKFFKELTFEEIASVLEVPLSTIKSRLYSGLEMLKTRLGAE